MKFAKDLEAIPKLKIFPLFKLQIVHPDSLVDDYVSLSLGVTCVIPQSQYAQKQLLVTADKALYQAKQEGRDRAVLQLLD